MRNLSLSPPFEPKEPSHFSFDRLTKMSDSWLYPDKIRMGLSWTEEELGRQEKVLSNNLLPDPVLPPQRAVSSRRFSASTDPYRSSSTTTMEDVGNDEDFNQDFDVGSSNEVSL